MKCAEYFYIKKESEDFAKSLGYAESEIVETVGEDTSERCFVVLFDPPKIER